MNFPLPDDDGLFQALVDRNPAFEGRAFVGVKTTGVFCRITCPARKPRRENCIFFETAGACIEAGFRPCQRCRPLESGSAPDPVVKKLVDLLEADPSRRWKEIALAEMGLDPSTVRRAFKRHFGTTFLGMARLVRLRTGATTVATGGRIIDAQLDAGFDSGSGFRSAFARVLGRSPAKFEGSEELKADWIDTPLGAMIAIADDRALHLLEFFDRPELAAETRKLERETGCAVGIGRTMAIDQVEHELVQYYSGKSFAFRAPLATGGSSFSRHVWTSLQQIPPGRTRSYAELAAMTGRPSAIRAVARACAANRLAVVIPCHRILGSDGSLTGYGGGIWRKRWLIEHERSAFRPVAGP